MRVLTTLVAAVLAATSSAAVAAAAHPDQPGHHHHHKVARPDLFVPAMTAAYANGQVTAAVYVTNKGRAKAAATRVRVYLSTDAVAGAGDVVLGDLPIKKLRPGRTDYPITPLAVPSTVVPGSYHVLACADSTRKVKEKKEHNNCGAAPSLVTVPQPAPPPPPPGTVTIGWSATFGKVTATVTAGAGACTPAATKATSGSCVVTAGDATVQLVASDPAANYTWHVGGWHGSPCAGTVSNDVEGVGATMTVVDATTDQTCQATFPFG